MLDFLIRLYCTPENVIGLLLDILLMVDMYLIFKALGEKGWKSLVPVYNKFLLYKHTWNWKWFFLFEVLAGLITAKCLSTMRKHIVSNIFHTIGILLQEQKLEMDIDISMLFICLGVYAICSVFLFIMRRITYYKIAAKFQMATWIKVGALILPEIFLLVSVIKYRKAQNTGQ